MFIKLVNGLNRPSLHRLIILLRMPSQSKVTNQLFVRTDDRQRLQATTEGEMEFQQSHYLVRWLDSRNNHLLFSFGSDIKTSPSQIDRQIIQIDRLVYQSISNHLSLFHFSIFCLEILPTFSGF